MARAAALRGSSPALGTWIRRPARLRGLAVWALTAGVGAASLALFATVSGDVGTPALGFRLPWWLLVPGFLVAEATVVHLHFRRDAHSFTLSEVPLAFALAAASPVDAVLGRLIGGTIVVLVRGGRRFSAAKVVFNVALFSLEITLALAVFHALSGGSSISRAVPAVLVAAATVAVLGTLLVGVAMRVSGAWLGGRGLLLALGIATAVAITNACLGLVGIATYSVDPWLVSLLAVPAGAVFLGYRAHGEERRRRRHYEFLLETTRLLQRARDLDVALAALLRHLADGFRGEFAQITLASADREGTALRSTLYQDGRVETMIPVALASSAEGTPAHATVLDPARAHEEYGLRDAIVAPLRGEHVIGTVVVGDHEGNVATFDRDDVALFETFGAHAGMALENERLETSLRRLRDLQEQLQHQASHDALTELPNRVLFAERVEAALDDASPSNGVAVLFIDVDDFKNVNDTVGHSAGDELLIAVANRLRDCVDTGDTVARLGGDEFGVLVQDGTGRSAPAVAERVVHALCDQVALSVGLTATVSASVGVAVARPNQSVEELLRNADLAMYAAKASGKGRYALFTPEMHAAVAERAAATNALRRAIRDRAIA